MSKAIVDLCPCLLFQALDTLGSTKWRVNRRVLDVLESMWSRGGNVAGLIDREDVSEGVNFYC